MPISLFEKQDLSLLVANKRNLLDLSSTTSLEDCLEAMFLEQLIAVPVYTIAEDGGKKYIGIVNMMDILTYVAFATTSGDEILTKDSVIKPAKLDRPISDLIGISSESQTVWVYPESTCLAKLVEHFFKGVHHAIVERSNGTRVVASQTDVLLFALQNKDELSAQLQRPVSTASKQLRTVPGDEIVLQAFRTLGQNEIKAAAVVDGAGKLVGNLSASDLRGMSKQFMDKLTLPVLEYLSLVNNDVLPAPITCQPDATLAEVIECALGGCDDKIFQQNRPIHRVWQVDADGKPVGVVSMSDMLHQLLQE
eukprot:TRINITY_DN107_c0_g1_i1.p1 TRINITY_DN107_c0_g1~~TRINITY_DN107_c0_g1_i1.p1  ORF type:complete len:308 (+),score=70.59 TRINITY_DN107_c0_g1_i1:110-1033(+)